MSEPEYHVSSYVVRVQPEDGQSVSRVIASITGLEVHAEEDGKLIVTAEAENVRELADLTVGGFIAGIIFWGGFNTALEATNSEEFCISCHEMEENVYQELRQTIHFSNRSGVRATCPDCHVPHDWTDKIARKMQATKEVWGTIFQTISTREKFLAKRRELADMAGVEGY